MKTQVSRFGLVAVTALVLSSGVAFSADSTAPAQATPGTPAATDTKTQTNDPAGPAMQTPAHPREGTKKKKHHTHAPAQQTETSGDKATKTPQATTPPSTTNP